MPETPLLSTPGAPAMREPTNRRLFLGQSLGAIGASGLVAPALGSSGEARGGSPARVVRSLDYPPGCRRAWHDEWGCPCPQLVAAPVGG